MIIQTMIPYEIILERLEEVIKRRIQPEIYFNATTLDRCRDEEIMFLGETLEKHGISFTFHAPFMDLAPGGVDSKIRRATRERLEHIFRLAALIKPKVVVCHPGYDRWRYGEVQDLWIKGSQKMWNPLVKEAEKIGVTLALENVFEEDPETIQRLLEEINSTHFGFCFDTGHWLLFSKRTLEEWIERLGKWVVEIHIHDNNGEKDQHLPPGDGKFDFPRFFHILWAQKIVPIYTVEVHQESELLRSLEMVKHYVEDLKKRSAEDGACQG